MLPVSPCPLPLACRTAYFLKWSPGASNPLIPAVHRRRDCLLQLSGNCKAPANVGSLAQRLCSRTRERPGARLGRSRTKYNARSVCWSPLPSFSFEVAPCGSPHHELHGGDGRVEEGTDPRDQEGHGPSIPTEHAVSGLPLCLGLVHCKVRPPKQFGRVPHLRTPKGDADARAYADHEVCLGGMLPEVIGSL